MLHHIMGLAPLIIPATLKQTATIIFLHGLGDTGYGLSEIFKELRPAYAKLICPTAPIKNVTLYDTSMPTWFDLRPMDQPKDEDGIQASRKMVEDLVTQEITSGIPESRIILGGFSQGGALALFTGLFGNYKLGGVLALSCWLPFYKSANWETIKRPQILQCHGNHDDVVDISRALKTKAQLEPTLPTYKFNAYPGLDHSLNSSQLLLDIKQFFTETIPPTTSSSSKL